MPAYDYYSYDMNGYGYYGGQYGGGNFYDYPGRGRSAGKCLSISSHLPVFDVGKRHVCERILLP